MVESQTILLPILNDDGKNSTISPHFGKAPFFAIMNRYDDGTFSNVSIIKQDLDHSDTQTSPIVQAKKKYGVSVIIASHMGPKAQSECKREHITLLNTNEGSVKQTIADFDTLQELTQHDTF